MTDRSGRRGAPAEPPRNHWAKSGTPELKLARIPTTTRPPVGTHGDAAGMSITSDTTVA